MEAKRETQFYTDRSAALARFIRVLCFTLSAISSIDAVIGSTTTKHSDVGCHTREIGILRALGLRRGSIMTSLLAESVALSLLSWGARRRRRACSS